MTFTKKITLTIISIITIGLLTISCTGNKKKSILMVVTSHTEFGENHKTGVWLEELAAPYTAFKANNFNVVVASIKGGYVSIDPQSKPKNNQATEWKEAVTALKNTISIDKIKASHFDAIFLPGGHGTMFDFPSNKKLQSLLQQFAVSNKIIASICHGPAALVNATLPDGTPLVAGKKLTSFTNEEERSIKLEKAMPFLLETRLRKLGAQFVPNKPWADHIEQDGILLTGQNPMSSTSLAKAVIKKLKN